jgi:hypothetical protein
MPTYALNLDPAAEASAWSAATSSDMGSSGRMASALTNKEMSAAALSKPFYFQLCIF